MGRISASVTLPYPPERVWRVATRVDDLPRWMPEVVGAELLDPQLALGSRARLRLSAAAAGAVVTASVTEFSPPARLVMRGTGGPLGVVMRVSLQPPPFLSFVAREVERRLEAGLPGSLERLRALIEAEPA
jgi:uncharacterized protein YndB with AHSA1/START domain